MTQFVKPFEPVAGGTIKVTTSTTASVVTGTTGDLPNDCDVVVITNDDATDKVFVRVSPKASASIAVADADIPVKAGQQIRISVPRPAKFSVVAGANTPVVYVTPGKGN